MNKRAIPRKIISIIIATVILSSVFAPIFSAQTVGMSSYVKEIDIRAASNLGNDFSTKLYQYNDSVLINVTDASSLTNFAVTKNTAKEVVLMNGIREVTINVKKGNISDTPYENFSYIDVIDYNDQRLVHANKLFSFLGATCIVCPNSGNPLLYVNAVDISMSEVILAFHDTIERGNVFYDDYDNLDLNLLLVCSMGLDLLYGYEHDLFTVQMADYYEDAIWTILNVDISKDTTIQQLLYNEYLSTVNKANSDIGGIVIENILDTKSDEYDAYNELFDKYYKKTSDLNLKKIANIESASGNVPQSELLKMTEDLDNSLTNELTFKELSDKYDQKSNALKGTQKVLDIAALSYNIYKSTQKIASVSNDMKLLFNEVFSDEYLDEVGYKTRLQKNSPDLYKAIERARKKNDGDALAAYYQEICKQGIPKLIDYGNDYLISKTPVVNHWAFYTAVWDISKPLSISYNKEIFASSAAKLEALVICAISEQLMKEAAGYIAKALEENGSDPETLLRIQSILKMYCYSVYAMNDQLLIAASSGDEKLTNLSQRIIEDQKNIANLLYMVGEAPFYAKVDITNAGNGDFDSLNHLFDAIVPPADSDDQSYTLPVDLPIVTDYDDRDIVLVLDVSGSMYGEPLEQTKEAAKRFVYQSVGNNSCAALVTYETYATMVCDLTNDPDRLAEKIDKIESGNLTNTMGALTEAKRILSTSGASKKIIVLMSDGLPNVNNDVADAYESGKNYYDEIDFKQELIDMSDELKSSGVIIYTLGFFQNLMAEDYNESWQYSSAQNLLEAIATDGYFYNISSADNLAFFFDDVSETIAGQYSILIKIECPVDVYVTSNGETLSSVDGSSGYRTSFGSISFGGNNNESKILRLQNDSNYNLTIVGYDTGVMDYSISYPNSDGLYIDSRKISDVPISPNTVIETTTVLKRKTVLKVDSDGDGIVDTRLSAKGTTGGNDGGAIAMIVISSLLLLGILLWYMLSKHAARFNTLVYCEECGTAIHPGETFCCECGRRRI
ncbi:MAG: VWA domain-containing protein [Ruminococcaceae bacterium]|nr:VWA domain-containing protein [Oscillospiraceae bacterium]